MWSSLSPLLATLAPVFALMVVGRLLVRWRVLTDHGVEELGRLLYWVLLPVQLLAQCSRSDIRQAFEPGAVLAAILSFVVGLLAAWIGSGHLQPAERGCVLSGAARANGAFVGLPVVGLLALQLGPAGAALSTAYAVVLACLVPVFNLGAVVGFRLPHHGLTWAGVRSIASELPRNPIILGCTAGVALGLVHPGLLSGTVTGTALDLLGGAAIPLALLLTGAQLDLTVVRGRPLLLALTTATKLIAVPLVCWGLCRWLGVSASGTLAATVLMASPVAMASAPMARLLGGDDRLMGALIVTSTVASPLTLLGWLWWLTG